MSTEELDAICNFLVCEDFPSQTRKLVGKLLVECLNARILCGDMLSDLMEIRAELESLG